MNTILQVPIDKELKNKAASTAERMGFSSLQEVIRLFINKMATGNINVSFEETTQLSPKAIKRYNRIIDEIDSNKEEMKSFSNTKDLMKYLNED